MYFPWHVVSALLIMIKFLTADWTQTLIYRLANIMRDTVNFTTGIYIWLFCCSSTTTKYKYILWRNLLCFSKPFDRKLNVSHIRISCDMWHDKRQTFYPFRFSPEEKARRDPYDHIPFGYGPRNCIVMRLAVMEIIMSAALVLKHFTFVRCEKTKVSQWSRFSYW